MVTNQELVDIINSIDSRLLIIESQVNDINLTSNIRKRRIDKMSCRIDNIEKQLVQMKRGEHDGV